MQLPQTSPAQLQLRSAAERLASAAPACPSGVPPNAPNAASVPQLV